MKYRDKISHFQQEIGIQCERAINQIPIGKNDYSLLILVNTVKIKDAISPLLSFLSVSLVKSAAASLSKFHDAAELTSPELIASLSLSG